MPARTSRRRLDPPSPEWARVRIHLNLGEMDAASVLAEQLTAATPWRRSRQVVCGRTVIHPLADMPVGWCWLDAERCQAIMNEQVVRTFAMANSMFSFVEVAVRMEASAFRRYDVRNWAQLERLDDAAAGWIDDEDLDEPL